MSHDSLMRSLLFVPAHNEKLLASASRSKADVLLLDVEDSVQPVKNKQVARNNIIDWVSNNKFGEHLIYPRINDRESGHLLKDVSQLSIPGVSGFMFPKSERGEDVYFFDKLLETIEYEKGYEIGTFRIIPLIETTSAVMHLNEICESSKRITAIAFGCEDYLTDLGGGYDIEGMSIFTARSMIAMAAKSKGIIPVDTVHIRIHDLEDLEKNLKIAKNLGFEGMLNLHPKELPLTHEYFSPSEKEYLDAVEMLALSNEAERNNQGVAYLNNKFIGPPMVKAAKKVIAKFEYIQKKDS